MDLSSPMFYTKILLQSFLDSGWGEYGDQLSQVDREHLKKKKKKKKYHVSHPKKAPYES